MDKQITVNLNGYCSELEKVTIINKVRDPYENTLNVMLFTYISRKCKEILNGRKMNNCIKWRTGWLARGEELKWGTRAPDLGDNFTSLFIYVDVFQNSRSSKLIMYSFAFAYSLILEESEENKVSLQQTEWLKMSLFAKNQDYLLLRRKNLLEF